MKEITIGLNDDNQRIDRFLKKYLAKANSSFIYKMIRKKRIKVNNSKINPEDMIKEGDKIQFYFSDETLEKFMRDEKEILEGIDLDILYEDENIMIIDKPKGVLSHSANGDYSEENIVSNMVSYLYNKGEYSPRVEKTFTPSICNRLDRNTSGLLIGAKNYDALKAVNEAIRDRHIDKYYLCVVKGKVDKAMELRGYLDKDEDRNMVSVSDRRLDSEKEIATNLKPLKSNDRFSLLEIELITGRTHQIRAHLASIGHPIVGDRKYGDKKTNEYFKDKYRLESQFLHAYRLCFSGLEGKLAYLNGKEFKSQAGGKLKRIEQDLF